MKYESGFSLIELMIVITIIGILAAISVSFYLPYTQRVDATSKMFESEPFKLAVSHCLLLNGGGLSNCDAGAEGIPNVSGAVLSVIDGAIEINLGDIDGDSNLDKIKLNPVLSFNTINWTVSSSGGTDACSKEWLKC